MLLKIFYFLLGSTAMGNEKSNIYWEAELPPNYDRVGIENFIRAKYVLPDIFYFMPPTIFTCPVVLLLTAMFMSIKLDMKKKDG